MILSKEGVLTAIYSNNKPIGISFSFLSDKIMFFAITSFDIDYMRYNLGHITIMKLMNWCFDNGFDTYDFSKGKYEYKDRWTNNSYNYECHILYDSSSLVSRIRANIFESYFVIKQYLRDKNVNKLYTQFKYRLKAKDFDKAQNYLIEKVDNFPNDLNDYILIDINEECYVDIRYNLFEHLYSSPEKVKSLKIFKTESSIYYVVGEKNKLKMSLVN